MGNLVQIFENTEFGSIRTVTIDGEPWFVGKDIAKALGYSNSKDALLNHVDKEDKLQKDGVVIYDPIGREQKPVFINESGLYSLILTSRLPNAKRFKRWVTKEVLPSVRRHGIYATDEILADSDKLEEALRQVKEYKNKVKGLEEKVNSQIEQIKELSDKKNLLQGDNIKTSDIATLYGLSGRKLNAFLQKQGVQYKCDNEWHLRPEYINKGYENIITFQRPTWTYGQRQMRWTRNGAMFICSLLDKAGYHIA